MSNERFKTADIRTINLVGRDIVDSAIKVHKLLGPGLLESSYTATVAHELRVRGHQVATQVTMPVEYCGVRLDIGYHIDMIVDDLVIVEFKAVAKILPVHKAQLLSHQRPSGMKLGFLINFHVRFLKDGIKRMVYAADCNKAQSPVRAFDTGGIH